MPLTGIVGHFKILLKSMQNLNSIPIYAVFDADYLVQQHHDPKIESFKGKKFKAKNCEKFSYMNVKIYIYMYIYLFHPRYLITMILGT